MMEPLLPQLQKEYEPDGRSGSCCPPLRRLDFRPSLRACVCLKSLGVRLVQGVLWWWQVTTDADFLRSRISRRQSLKTSLLAIAVVSLASDFMSAYYLACHWWWPLPDLLLVVGAYWYRVSSVGAESMCVDVAAVAVATVILCLGEGGSFMADDYDPIQSLMWYPGYMVVAAFAGLHSLTGLWVWGLSLLWAAVWSTASSHVEIAFFAESLSQGVLLSTLVAVVWATFELAMAVLYREFQTQLACNQKLLEGATDGFGIADSLSGLVLEASPKMLLTLGNESLVGQSLRSGIDDSQTSALPQFFGTTDSETGPAPVLVTWSMGNLECEVRMVPYALQGSRIFFSVQRIGEARSPPTPAAAAERAVVDAQGGEHQGRGGSRARGKAFGRKVLRTVAWGGLPGQGREDSSLAASAAASASRRSSAHDDDHDVAFDGDFDNFENFVRHMPSTPSRAASAASRGGDQDTKSQSSSTKSGKGTVSLSSWTISNASAEAAQQGQPQQRKRRKKVSLRTMGTQTLSQKEQLPPAPLSASSFPSFEQAKAARKARLARRSAAIVEEGNPRVPTFQATPLATRLHTLQTVARSCNVTGKGCCHKHIAWAGLQALISDLMLQPCGDFQCFSGWQCPHCLAVHDFEDGSDVDEEEMQSEQFCTFCIDSVSPLLPSSELPARLGQPTAVVEEVSAASPSASSSDELIGPNGGYAADLEVQIDVIESDG